MNATVEYLQEALMVLTDKLQHRDRVITDLSERVEVLTKDRDELATAAKLVLRTLEQGGMLHRVQTITARNQEGVK